MPEKRDVFQELSNWACILIQGCRYSSLGWMPAHEIEGIPYCLTTAAQGVMN